MESARKAFTLISHFSLHVPQFTVYLVFPRFRKKNRTMALSKMSFEELVNFVGVKWVEVNEDVCDSCEPVEAYAWTDDEKLNMPTAYALVNFVDGQFRTTVDMAVVKTDDLKNLKNAAVKFNAKNVCQPISLQFILCISDY
jgi:hypothetical protein